MKVLQMELCLTNLGFHCYWLFTSNLNDFPVGITFKPVNFSAVPFMYGCANKRIEIVGENSHILYRLYKRIEHFVFIDMYFATNTFVQVGYFFEAIKTLLNKRIEIHDIVCINALRVSPYTRRNSSRFSHPLPPHQLFGHSFRHF